MLFRKRLEGSFILPILPSSVNRQIRKIIKNKGFFPDDKSITKIVFLTLKNAAKKWTMPIREWSLALNQFEILCGDFKYQLLENEF
ncbi:transposase [Rickettsia bellii]|uniref:Transposase and inactivated derivative n=2 Tax=Rickettsia bellii TaxID=33990 RepID=Q1RIW6_RICBR|nr:Transposase and inactivated derivative [Rickettsia bellii RML369-C]ARD86805.1 transposase [Rickettsia bellii]KJV89485.1 transposase, Mutator family protein [Rickettsia bellii str. RML An4]